MHANFTIRLPHWLLLHQPGEVTVPKSTKKCSMVGQRMSWNFTSASPKGSLVGTWVESVALPESSCSKEWNESIAEAWKTSYTSADYGKFLNGLKCCHDPSWGKLDSDTYYTCLGSNSPWCFYVSFTGFLLDYFFQWFHSKQHWRVEIVSLSMVDSKCVS